MVDLVWLILTSTLVFIMQAGFAMVESGLTRSKNSINVAIKNLTDFGISSIAFWVVGFAFMFGESQLGLIGTSSFIPEMSSLWVGAFFLFQLMFCSTSTTIVSGAVAERMKFGSYMVIALILSAVVYPVFGHWAWGGMLNGTPTGWLAKDGFVDFAGSTVVHSMGGWVSLAALLVIGPRIGRFGPNGEVNTINGSNIPMAILGVMLLWFGWFGFNGGSTLALNEAVPKIIINTTLAGASGMIGTLLICWLITKKPDANAVINGSLAGLVAITANCHAVNEAQALVIGFVGGIIMMGLSWLLEKLKIDDAVGAVPVHLGAGIWGTLAVALFGNPRLLNTGLGFFDQLKIQCLGILSCGLWAFGLSFLLFQIINKISSLRVSHEEEYEGLNKAEHGVTTEILDFYQVLHKQSETGELSLRAPVEPFTEIGQIAKIYNAVMDKLEFAQTQYVSILDNVSDGLFLIDKAGEISPFYSTSLEKILETSHMGGQSFLSLLSPYLPEKVILATKDFLELTFDPNKTFRTVEKFNPLCDTQFTFPATSGPTKVKHLQFVFKRIGDAKNISQIMVLARDVTKQKELAIEVEETRNKTNSEMELFYRILHIEPDMLSQFMAGANDDLFQINSILSSNQEVSQDLLSRIFRHVHAIKGDADMLGLEPIAQKAQSLETSIQELLLKSHVNNTDFLPLILKITDIKSTIGKVSNILEKWALVHATGGQTEIKADYLTRSLGQLVKRLSDRYEKKVALRCDFPSFEELEPKLRKQVHDSLVQMIRNSVYHGIEAPHDRQDKNKKPEGLIQIEGQIDSQGIRVIFSDDGQGLNMEKIVSKAVESMTLTKDQAKKMSENDIAKLIFKPHFSTADSVDTTAGRGVGMDMIHSFLIDVGGKIQVKSKRNQGLSFEIFIPQRAS